MRLNSIKLLRFLHLIGEPAGLIGEVTNYLCRMEVDEGLDRWERVCLKPAVDRDDAWLS